MRPQFATFCRACSSAFYLPALLAAGFIASTSNILAVEAPDIAPGETIVIRAERAWETRTDGVRALHFEGNFQLEAPDWFIVSEQAVVIGDVDDPQRIEVSGNPARVWMLNAQGEEDVDARANSIAYYRHNKRLLLTGNARLRERNNTMKSSSIDYDLGNSRLAATGPGGVEIIAMPKREPSAATPTTGPAND